MIKRSYLLILALAIALSGLITPLEANAVTASDWRAGNIIDDSLFTNSSSMSVAQIQTWLDARLRNCDYNGTQRSELSGGVDYDRNGVITRAEYGRAKGNPAPFTCLNKFYEVPKTQPGSRLPANNYGKSTIPSGAKSAAQLIYDAGRAYNISPKVLLVKLGTESAGPLTSDPWPFQRQYLYAMGAHCPDSGPGGSANCDSNYAGFSLQMREAAKLLRWYLDSMSQSWWSYKKPRTTNHILWNVVETRCGGSNVYIENSATAALYTYTPYQPNAAALRNMYGTGDGCSAYGNRNFWRVYNDWFGSSAIPTLFKLDNSRSVYINHQEKYYFVPTNDVLTAYGHTYSEVKTIPASRISSLAFGGNLSRIVRFGGDAIFLVDKGKRYSFPSATSYANDFGYRFGDETNLPPEAISMVADGGNLSDVLRSDANHRSYLIQSKKRHHITTPEVFTTQGDPVYATRSRVTLSDAYINSIQEGAPILKDGSLVSDPKGTVYFWSGTNRFAIDKNSFDNYRLAVDYKATQPATDALSISNVKLGRLLASSDGTRYIIEGGKKLVLTAKNVTDYGITATFTPASEILLNKFQTIPFPRLVRVGNAPAVYTIRDGQLSTIHSPLDLRALGYTWAEVVTVATDFTELFQDRGKIELSPGRLVRIEQGEKIYLVDNSRNLRWIPNRPIFLQYGFRSSQVTSISYTASKDYAEVEPISFLIQGPGNELWLPDVNKRWSIPSDYKQHFSTGNTHTDSPVIPFASLTPAGQVNLFIRVANEPAIYKMLDGKKHLIADRESYARNGGNQSGTTTLDKSTLQAIPSGSTLH